MASPLCPGPAFPLLVPTDRHLRAWEGFVSVHDARGAGHQFWLRVSGCAEDPAPSGATPPPLAGATFTPGDELAALLPDVLPLLHRRLRCSDTLASFLTDVCAAARAALDARSGTGHHGGPQTPGSVEFVTAVATQLARLPAGCVSDVSSSLEEVTLSHTDGAGRVHSLRVRLPHSFPDASPVVVAHDLPSDLQLDGGDIGLTEAPQAAALPVRQQPVVTLASLLAALQRACDRHATLWAALGGLDAKCVVVDPPPGEGPPPWRIRSRRIALGAAANGGTGATLLVELPPSNGAASGDESDAIGAAAPVVRLSGPEGVVSTLRPRLATALATWMPVTDSDALRSGTWLYDWLTAAVGQPLPAPRPAQGPADMQLDDDHTSALECGICYSVAQPRMDTGAPGDAAAAQQAPAPAAAAAAPVVVPDVWCDNPRCGRAFHAACLAVWLREAGGVGGAQRSSFSRLFGECPYCRTQISVLAPADE